MVGVINYFYEIGIYIKIRIMMLIKYKFLRGFGVLILNMVVKLLCN